MYSYERLCQGRSPKGLSRVRYAEQNSAELNGGRKPLL